MKYIALLIFALTTTALPAQFISVGSGSYRDTLPNDSGCPLPWQGPATSFDGGIPATPLVTGNLAGKPIPTNDWWSSLIWPTGVPTTNKYSSPLIAYPLTVQAAADGLLIGDQDSSTAVDGRVGFASDMTVGISGLNASEVRGHDFGDWTVTADWSNSALRATFGRGLPYVYFERSILNDAIVTITGVSNALISNSGGVALVRSGGAYYGIFGPSGSTWTRIGNQLASSLDGKSYFSVALIPASNDSEALSKLPEFAAIAYNFVSNSVVSWEYDESSALLTTTFDLTFDQKEPGLARSFMALLPHQWRYSPTVTTGEQYDSVFGVMEVVEGSSFQTVYKFNGVLPTLPLVAEPGSGFNRGTLKTYLQELANFNPPLIDTYFGGKDIAKLLQAALIADQVSEADLATRHVNAAKQVLEDWFSTDQAEENLVESCNPRRALYYDSLWGTLIGFPASFGSNTYLNDHHFHYGYWLMTAAMIAQFDPNWAALESWGGMVELLIRDVASLDRDDELFPFLRSFDPYAGHAWAGGPGDFASGNNQESTSESMNFWAGMIFWGENTGNIELRDAGIYMYATEAVAIEEYWFDVHEEIFPRIDYDEEVTGILFGDGVAYATFFSGEEEAILGIQNIPVTGSMLYWGRNPDEVIEVFDEMVAKNNAQQGFANAPFDLFQDLLWSFLATSDASRAISLFDTANAGSPYGVEGGESRAHTYHWLHNWAALGHLDQTVTADTPTYAVFEKSGEKTYAAYNASDELKTVTYSDGVDFRVLPGQLVGVKRPMAVSLASPSPGEILELDSSITFTAIVDHLDDLSITRVEFFVGGSSIGFDTTSPFEVEFTPMVEGTFEASVVARDSNGDETRSEVVTFSAKKGQLPFGGVPKVIVADATTRIEAEEYDVGDQNQAYLDLTNENEGNPFGNDFRTAEGVDTERTTDAGGGYNVGYMAAGEYMEYTLEVQERGLYDLDFRVAATDPGPEYSVSVDGSMLVESILVPNTNGFQNWATVRADDRVLLEVGVIVLRITTVVGLGNINWFEMTGPFETQIDAWYLY